MARRQNVGKKGAIQAQQNQLTNDTSGYCMQANNTTAHASTTDIMAGADKAVNTMCEMQFEHLSM
jgi:hypothetical protein